MTDVTPPPQGQPEHVLLRIGDIGISRTFVVTPTGTCRLDEASIDSIVQTSIVRRTPTWAVVVAVIFFYTLVALLFLFVKEERTNGFVMVTVDGPRFTHTSNVRVSSIDQVSMVQRDVAQVESLIDKAKLRG